MGIITWPQAAIFIFCGDINICFMYLLEWSQRTRDEPVLGVNEKQWASHFSVYCFQWQGFHFHWSHSGALQQTFYFFNIESNTHWSAWAITSSKFFTVELQICQGSFSQKKMKKKMSKFLAHFMPLTKEFWEIILKTYGYPY